MISPAVSGERRQAHGDGAGNDRFRPFVGYIVGGVIIVGGGMLEVLLGIPAEGKQLEQAARPLSAVAPPAQGTPTPPGMQTSGTAAA